MNRQSGFTFIEVLIAMLVLGVAVLAFAGLQVRALQTTSVAHTRAQATSLASDLAERMRVNPDQLAVYRAAGNFDGADSPVGAPSTWATPGDGCVELANVNQAGCSAAQMAQFDINEVEYLAGQLLPDGRVEVRACDDGLAGSDCVFVAWAGVDPADCDDSTSANCVMMSVMLE